MPLGGTGFANAAAAYDALPDSMKEAIEGLKGVFDFRGRKRSSPVSAEDIAAYPPVEHPIVRTPPAHGPQEPLHRARRHHVHRWQGRTARAKR